jgi:hypothetical protein
MKKERREEKQGRSRKTNVCLSLDGNGWLDRRGAGHAVAMEKRLLVEWTAVIFFLGTYFRGCGGGDTERSVFVVEILSYWEATKTQK